MIFPTNPNGLTVGTLFSGGGGSDLGAMLSGFIPAFSVEYDAAIAEVHQANIGGEMLVADVRQVDYTRFRGTDLLMASPPCPQFSVANKNKGETENDISLATDGVIRAIEQVQPRFVVIENVRAYQNSESWRLTHLALIRMGYLCEESVLNAASYNVPQTRERFIVRAVRGSAPSALPQKNAWRGWYQAIADLLPSCKDGELANWQKERLTEEYLQSWLEKHEAQSELPLFVEGCSSGDRAPTLRSADEPSITTTAVGGGRVHRAILPRPNAANDRFCAPSGESPSFAITGSLNTTKAVLMRVQGEGSDVMMEQADPAPTLAANHGANKYRTILFADQSGAAGEGLSMRSGKDPAQTITVGNGRRHYRCLLENAQVKVLDLRCMLRLQSFPDEYDYGAATRQVVSTLTGNAVPPQFAHAVTKGFPK